MKMFNPSSICIIAVSTNLNFKKAIALKQYLINNCNLSTISSSQMNFKLNL